MSSITPSGPAMFVQKKEQPKDILTLALNQNFQTVVVLGVTEEGNFYVSSSDIANNAMILIQRTLAALEGRIH